MNYFVSKQREIDKGIAKKISRRFNIDYILAQILVSRGIDTVEKAESYLCKDINNLHDPFLLSGMKEACDMINDAVSSNKSIVIYGDYDADGICSVAALYLYFKSLSARVNWYIPEREEGYGINADSIDYIISSYAPDLFISADCGITAISEVEILKSKGVSVIITDHHNSNGTVPDCVVINPKVSADYPFKDLCGCGVVLKLIQALGGIGEAKKYIDIAAIATIGDSVELCGENRNIVHYGLKKLNESPRKGLKILFEAAGLKENINAYCVAFAVVPRINAAGRIGEAKRALALFYEEDEDFLLRLAEELNGENSKRQILCQQLFEKLAEETDSSGIGNNRCIAVIDQSSNDGVSGILASKLCEKYYRPAFVFCRSGEFLKGSGRSIEGINIFNMLSSMKDILERFGGHKYAAGVTIKEENLSAFREKAEKYLAGFGADVFIRRKYYDYDLTGQDINEDFARQLNIFEPCGIGNYRPQFLYKCSGINADLLKNYPSHLTFKLLNTNFIGFNFGDNTDILNSAENELLIEFQQSMFKGRLYDKGYLKDFNININSAAAQNKIISNYLLQAEQELCGGQFCDFKQYDDNQEGILFDSLKQFGTLIVVFSADGLERLYNNYPELKSFKLSVFELCDGNNISRILLAPYKPVVSGYDTVIFAEQPFSEQYISCFKSKQNSVYIPQKKCYNILKDAPYNTDRDTFKEYYIMMTDEVISERPFISASNYFYNVSKKYPEAQGVQFTVCYLVFRQLGLLSFDGRVKAQKGVKRELEESEIYNKLKKLKD
jgi:single-stranded-DNA-specific exonuclease RecJ